MLPINGLQAKLYAKLRQDLNVKVFDEVPTDSVMPIVVIGDYELSTSEVKDDIFIFDWKLDIYTEYEGKRQVNEIVSNVIESCLSLKDEVINELNEVDSVNLVNANIYRNEGYYIANVNIRIELI